MPLSRFVSSSFVRGKLTASYTPPDFVGQVKLIVLVALESALNRLAGDTARAATSGEVKDLRREAQELKAVVAEQALELRLLKKSMIADGGDEE